ncbi:MAG: hypothetical protein DMG06_27615 [Acidobacteria bacterium]|nr:MAG: hypothetical protein DMG06_27615 [Acidobacteriota bacterium]
MCGTSRWLLTSDFRILARGYQTLLFSSLGGSLYSVSGFRGEYKVDDEQMGPRIKGTSLAGYLRPSFLLGAGMDTGNACWHTQEVQAIPATNRDIP